MILGDTKKPSFKVSKNDNHNTPVEAWEFLLIYLFLNLEMITLNES